MRDAIDDPTAIESTCDAPPIDAEGPTDERCNADATTWVHLSSGIRLYVCEAHAAEVDRFDDVDTDDHPTVTVCEACQSLAPVDVVDFDGRCRECRV